MSTATIKAAFNAEAKGVAVCHRANVEYIEGKQVLTLSGLIGGQPFTHRSEPFEGDPTQMAIRLVPEVLRFKKFERALDEEVKTINMNTNRTGLRDALSVLKDKMAAAREKSLQATEKAAEAFDKQEKATSALNQYAAEVTKEADDVMAELGQFTNGAPE